MFQDFLSGKWLLQIKYSCKTSKLVLILREIGHKQMLATGVSSFANGACKLLQQIKHHASCKVNETLSRCMYVHADDILS